MDEFEKFMSRSFTEFSVDERNAFLKKLAVSIEELLPSGPSQAGRAIFVLTVFLSNEQGKPGKEDEFATVTNAGTKRSATLLCEAAIDAFKE